MSVYSNLLVDYYDEIVLSECTSSLFTNISAFLNRKGFNIIEEIIDKNNDINTVFKNEKEIILVCKCFSLNAIYIYLQTKYSMFYEYIEHCPNCGSEHVLEKIPYSCATEENFMLIEKESLGILPGAYDRLGVPIPNWKCKNCKMRWHHKLDLMRRYKTEK